MAEHNLSSKQTDTIGEIANISMGSSATSLSALLGNRKVDITTPTVNLIRKSESLDDFKDVCVLVHINYIKGLSGSNVLILKPEDVIKIADLMMGGEGNVAVGEISELQLSAVSEAMNQMMGSAATSMSQLLGRDVDITPPKTDNIDVESVKIFENLFTSNEIDFVKITFKLKVGDVIDSTMVQLYPITFATEMVNLFEKNE
ncbi:MAG: flagellar motor switch phosphatase FliY [Pseudobutyrivibrio sp.]|nr:flagellar motor switch phosphatase FliY [Pseudobutyrivibrio sp.]